MTLKSVACGKTYCSQKSSVIHTHTLKKKKIKKPLQTTKPKQLSFAFSKYFFDLSCTELKHVHGIAVCPTHLSE